MMSLDFFVLGKGNPLFQFVPSNRKEYDYIHLDYKTDVLRMDQEYKEFLYDCKAKDYFKIQDTNRTYSVFVTPWATTSTNITPHQIVGKLTEKDTEPSPYRPVFLTTLSMQVLRKSSTNAEGEFFFKDIAPGIYNIVSVDYRLTYNAIIYSGITATQ